MKPSTSFALLGLLVLDACAQSGVIVSRVDYAHQYEPLEVSAAGGGDREMKVTILGNPFSTPKSELDRSVVQSMQGRTFGVPVNFAIEPANTDPERSYRVVMAFNPLGVLDPDRLCASQADVDTSPNSGERVTLMGALCSSDSFLSHAIARTSTTGSYDPEKLDALVAQLTLALFPDENPHRKFDGDTGVRPI